MLDVLGLALGLLLARPDSLLPAPGAMFHARERAVDNWRRQAALNLDASPGTRAGLLLGEKAAAMPRCVRLNNYWCIKRGGWSGEIAADAEGHVAFASAAEGAAVAALLLRRYYVDYGLHSATAIVRRWAPASCNGPVDRTARGGAPDGLARRGPGGLARRGLGGTLRARWLAAHGRRLAGFGRLRGRASAVPDPLIGASGPSPVIALGLGAAPESLAAALPEALTGRPGPLPAPPRACAGDEARIAAYARRIAAGLAATPDADLALFDAAGRPTAHLARAMRAMAAVEIGPFGADAGLVEAAVGRAGAVAAARAPRAASPGAPAQGRVDEVPPPGPRP